MRDLAARVITRFFRDGMWRNETCSHGTVMRYRGNAIHGIAHYSCGCSDRWINGRIIAVLTSCFMDNCVACSEGCVGCVYGDALM